MQKIILATLVIATLTPIDLPAGELPRYDHVLVLIAENRSFDQIIDKAWAPDINALAKSYGLATNYYGVVHPSHANYIAMIGGHTFEIHDDDAWYCTRETPDRHCPYRLKLDPYVDHTISERSLVDQLEERILTWKGYYESIPAPESKAIFFPDVQSPVSGQPFQLYGAKHNAFLSFKTVQLDPDLASKIVGFDQLIFDLESGSMPNYAHIVPNQCNDMHGLSGPNVPDDCHAGDDEALIARGDRVIGDLVTRIQASAIWSRSGNVAVVITWDEDDDPRIKSGVQGCCGFDPDSLANFGGGHIPTIVITNRGPRHVVDPTPYNHYSLLRTTEEGVWHRRIFGACRRRRSRRQDDDAAL
jgi:phospholipase C